MHPILVMLTRRVALAVVTLFLVSALVFGSVALLPGDIAEAILGQAATPETVAAFRSELGLDQPIYIRYLDWLGAAVTGDFGNSLANGRPISELISYRIGNTLFLAFYASLLAVPVALFLGIVTAIYRNSYLDRLINLGALGSTSLPEFFIAYILIYIFTRSGIFPAIANINPEMSFGEKISQSILPALTLSVVVTAYMMRMTRAAIVDVLTLPYIEMARLKGMSPARVILVHAVPNALAPIVNVLALVLAHLITGVVVVEVVFVYPGLGQLLVDAVSNRDVTVVQAGACIFALAYVFLNLAADLVSTLSNPRIIHKR